VKPGLVPGWNVDKLDIAAGVREAAVMGFDDGEAQMVAEYALQRWARGEEDGAIKTARAGGIDLTSLYRMVAAAHAAANPAPVVEPEVVEPEVVAPRPEPTGVAVRLTEARWQRVVEVLRENGWGDTAEVIEWQLPEE